MRPEDERFMQAALDLAARAERDGEIPVGAVIVHRGRIVGRGSNRQIGDNDPTAHAEIVALREAARELDDYRLREATVYSTLEPCAMCAGALVTARLRRLVFGSRDLRYGAVRSKFRLADSDLLNHRLEISEGVLAGECLSLLRSFFRDAQELQHCRIRHGTIAGSRPRTHGSRPPHGSAALTKAPETRRMGVRTNSESGARSPSDCLPGRSARLPIERQMRPPLPGGTPCSAALNNYSLPNP